MFHLNNKALLCNHLGVCFSFGIVSVKPQTAIKYRIKKTVTEKMKCL